MKRKPRKKPLKSDAENLSKDWLRIEKASRLLGMSMIAFYSRVCEDATLPQSKQLGRDYFWHREELLEWRDKREG